MLRAVTCLFVALFASLSAVACLAQPQPHLAPAQHEREKVYLLRGFTNVLSPGIDELAQELKQKNVETVVANHVFALSLASEAIDDCRSGRVGTIVLVGHSFGATGALMMADRLDKVGMHVALVVTLDPVIKNSVPGNVVRLENFYVSSGVGTTVQPGANFHGSLKNVDLKDNPELGHISVTTFPAMQKQVVHDILAANARCR